MIFIYSSRLIMIIFYCFVFQSIGERLQMLLFMGLPDRFVVLWDNSRIAMGK